MSNVVFLPPRLVRERLAATKPTAYVAPPLCAPIVWGSAADVLGALLATLVGVLVVAALWAPIILAGVWLFRRLHHH